MRSVFLLVTGIEFFSSSIFWLFPMRDAIKVPGPLGTFFVGASGRYRFSGGFPLTGLVLFSAQRLAGGLRNESTSAWSTARFFLSIANCLMIFDPPLLSPYAHDSNYLLRLTRYFQSDC